MRSAADYYHRLLADHDREQQRQAARWYRNTLDAVRREAHRKSLRRQEKES